MLCVSPIKVKVGVLKKVATTSGLALVPCGQCINCRINQKRILQNRIILESCMWANTTFVTLTYNEDNLPHPPYVSVNTTQVFIRKLRRRMTHAIRYYVVGEYGNQTYRPHYHAILFGVHPEKEIGNIATAWTTGKGKLKCNIEQLQPKELTPELASYCAGYVAKKAKDENNRWIDRDFAFIYKHYPKKNREFATWSNGLGKEAIKICKDKVDVWNEEFKCTRTAGRKYPLGRYLKQFSENKKNWVRSVLEFRAGQERAFDKRMDPVKTGKYNTDRRAL